MGSVLDLAELGRVQLELLQLRLDHAQRELGRVDGHLASQVHQQVRQRARVVLVAVRDDDAAKLLLVLEHVGVVGQHQVDAGLLVVGEHQARVHEHHVVAVLECGHVLTNAVEASQRDDPQRRLLFRHCQVFPFDRFVSQISFRQHRAVGHFANNYCSVPAHIFSDAGVDSKTQAPSVHNVTIQSFHTRRAGSPGWDSPLASCVVPLVGPSPRGGAWADAARRFRPCRPRGGGDGAHPRASRPCARSPCAPRPREPPACRGGRG